MTARELAESYKAEASHVWANGERVAWKHHGGAEVYAFMVAVCDELAALRAELAPEGPVALAASRRQVEVLEARVEALMAGECVF